jgi:hypothetical protein
MSYSRGIVNLEMSLPRNLNLNSNWSIELGKGEKKIENKKEKTKTVVWADYLILAHLPFSPWPKLSPRVPAPLLTDVWARVLGTRLQPSSHVWRSFAVSFGAACGADLWPDASNESSRRNLFTQSLGRSGSLPARHRIY